MAGFGVCGTSGVHDVCRRVRGECSRHGGIRLRAGCSGVDFCRVWAVVLSHVRVYAACWRSRTGNSRTVRRLNRFGIAVPLCLNLHLQWRMALQHLFALIFICSGVLCYRGRTVATRFPSALPALLFFFSFVWPVPFLVIFFSVLCPRNWLPVMYHAYCDKDTLPLHSSQNGAGLAACCGLEMV